MKDKKIEIENIIENKMNTFNYNEKHIIDIILKYSMQECDFCLVTGFDFIIKTYMFRNKPTDYFYCKKCIKTMKIKIIQKN